MVTCAYHLATWEVDIRRIKVPGQHRQKSSQDPISMEKSYGWRKALAIPATTRSAK
jgi:hypothetical protein